MTLQDASILDEVIDDDQSVGPIVDSNEYDIFMIIEDADVTPDVSE